MRIEEMAEWANSKSCGPHRRGEGCDDEACSVNDEALELIRALRRIDTQDSSGISVNGWIIDD